jgi:hypothetical protein
MKNWHYVYGAVRTTPDGPEDGGQCVAVRASNSNLEPTEKDAALRLMAEAPAMRGLLQRVADYWAGGDVPEDLDADMRALLGRFGGVGIDTFQAGRWTVRMLWKGDKYGLGDCLTHEGDDPLVEFYDSRQDRDKFGPWGQFVQRHYAGTLLSHPPGHGIDLYVGVPGWQVTWSDLWTILVWIEDQVVERAA